MSQFDNNSVNIWLFSGGAGMLGRLMFHAMQVQKGMRKPLSWMLLWDIPIALGMGWAALGLGVWLKLEWEATVSMALVVSYLGPHMLDLLFAKWAEFRFKTKE